jgi:hypothetical protein
MVERDADQALDHGHPPPSSAIAALVVDDHARRGCGSRGGVGGDLLFVGDQDDRSSSLAEPLEDPQHLLAVELVSRLPVGSSARIIAGLVTSARAIATRCCWPPDSSEACGPRAARPTRERRERPRRRSARQPRVGERQLDVGERPGARDQVEALEHEPDEAVAQVGQRVLVERANVEPFRR